MSEDINLTLTTKEDKKKGNIVFLFSLGVLCVVFVVSAILIVVSLFISSKARSLSDTELSLRNKIAAYSVQKAKLLSINERLSTIEKIVANRKKIDVRANNVLSIIPDGFTIEEFSADDKTMAVSLSSPRLSDFDTFLEEKIPIFSKDTSSGLSRINMDSFSQNKDGYDISLSFYY